MPELLYDAECPLCAYWADWWRGRKRSGVVLKALQGAGNAYPELAGELLRAIHLIEPDGRVSRGVAALLRAWHLAGGARWPLWLYEHCALTRCVTETGYRLMARFRPRRRG